MRSIKFRSSGFLKPKKAQTKRKPKRADPAVETIEASFIAGPGD
jgi:hypothetical protein